MSVRNMVGAALPITIDGVTYQTATQLRFDMRGEIEARIVSLRPDFMEEIGKSLKHFPREYHKEIIAEAVKRSAMANFVTNEEFDAYLNTEEGAAYLLWVMIREKQPEIDSLEKALAIAKKIDVLELQRKLDRAAGLSELKNSDGPAATSQAAGPVAEDAQAEARAEMQVEASLPTHLEAKTEEMSISSNSGK